MRSLIALLCVLPAALAAGGIEASVSSAGINYVIAQILPAVEAELTKITIPGTSGESHGFDYNLNTIQCPTFQIPSFTVAFAAPNQITINLQNLNLQCNADYWFQPHGLHFLRQSGSVDVTASSTSGTITIALGASNLEPTVSYVSGGISIGSLNITFKGNWLDWLINLFKPIIDGLVKNALAKEFPSILQTVVAAADTSLSKLKTSIPITLPAPLGTVEARYGLVVPPTAGSGYIGVALQGDIVPLNYPGVPPIPPPTIPPFDSTDAGYYVEVQLSTYFLLSAVWTVYQSGVAVFNIPSDKIPGGLNSTAAYLLIAPGLPLKYPGGAVGLEVSLGGLPTFDFSIKGGSTVWPFVFSFTVTPAAGGPAQPAFTFTADANVTLTLSLSTTGNLVLLGDLEYLGAQLIPGNSSVGPISGLPLLQDLVSFVLPDIVLPEINKALIAGIPLPQIPGLTFTKSVLSWGNGYVLLGLNFQFVPGQDIFAVTQ